MDRRTFLRTAARWSVALPGVSALAAACTAASGESSVAADAIPSASLTTSAARTNGTAWHRLAASLDGDLIRPGSAKYPTARLGYDPLFDDIHPRAIVRVASTRDVARTIAFAREHGFTFAARSGGHSYAGYSLSNGVVIDVSGLDDVTADVAAKRATVGSGASLMQVANGLAPDGLVVPGGTCATVGIAGLTMGGGQGVTGRRFGLTCDSLEAATVVLADGSVVHCDANRHDDLFWALRGGGGGNFGVVTSFTFAAHPLTHLTICSLSWHWSAAAHVLRAWSDWAPSAPHDLWSSLRLRWIPGSGPQVSMIGTWSGSPSGLTPVLNDLTSSVRPNSMSTSTLPYLDVAKLYAGCSGQPADECSLQIHGGTLPRQASLAKSDFFDHRISASDVDAMLGRIEARSTSALRGSSGGVIFDSWGGHIAQLGDHATAFPHRQARFLAQEFVTFSSVPDDATLTANGQWLTSLWHSLRGSASGAAYVNYIDPELNGWRQAYYGANLDRLVQVKRRYDPHDVFRFAQSVPTTLA
ncbi:MAG TPA: FAD-binding oxidoreductase [Actinomycetota bacterium]|nr:FAD-binding oxidoreductase [Actinomycetota bacterium]